MRTARGKLEQTFPLLLHVVALFLMALSCTSGSVPVGNTQGRTYGTTQFTLSPADSLPSSGVASIVERVRPCVVAVNDIIRSTSTGGAAQTAAAAGSGWIIDSNGVIVTNNHVVAGAQNIVVTLYDGRTFKATEVKTDPANDLAIIKVNASGLPAATTGNSSQLKMGDQVIAIGNALDDGIRVTGGLVSNLAKSISLSAGQTLYDLIETDAAINPGNSGGPLVNMAGEVIGIVNARVSASGVEGMAYAIATEDAIPVIQQLVNKGHAIVPWIGADFQTVNEGTAQVYGLPVSSGAMITSIAEGSPASSAGLRQYDVILTVDGKAVASASDAADAIEYSEVGQSVLVTYRRGNSTGTASVLVKENPAR